MLSDLDCQGQSINDMISYGESVKREFPIMGFDFGNNLENMKLPKVEKLE